MRTSLLRVGNALSLLGFSVFVASALAMILLWIGLITARIGWLGVALGLVTSPAAVAFPFVHWLVEGVFSWTYFWLWAAGVAGVVVSMAWVEFGRGRLGG